MIGLSRAPKIRCSVLRSRRGSRPKRFCRTGSDTTHKTMRYKTSKLKRKKNLKYYYTHREQFKKWNRDSQEKRRLALRTKYMLQKYHITPEYYDVLLKEQNFCCVICHKPEVIKNRKLAVDHNHSCCSGATSCGKCIRGLLCYHCNVILGQVEKLPFREYLDKPRKL